MSTQVFEQEKSMFFVGGRGGGDDAVANAGGCTQDWWDTEVALSDEATALAKLISVTGDGIINRTFCSYNFTNDRISQTNIAIGVEVGMVAYVIESDIPDTEVDTGRYVITDRDGVGDDWIECDGIEGTDTVDVDVIIGGAFTNLDTATDEMIASNYSVGLHTNISEVLGATIEITNGGSLIKNTFLTISGYNFVPGDMDRGSTYYQTPFEILQSGIIDLDKCVVLDADGGAVPAINIDADNVILKNIYFTNSNTAATITFTNAPQNIFFKNCRFSDGIYVCSGVVEGVTFDSCYSHSDLTHHYRITSCIATIIGCVGVVVATKNFVRANEADAKVIGCLVTGNAMSGVITTGVGKLFVSGNTFYNCSGNGVQVTTGSYDNTVINNIFMLEPGAAGLEVTTGGSFIYNDYNCFIETDGSPLTVGAHDAGQVAEIGEHSIEEDPLFVDVDANDFRLQSNSPCRRVGKPTIGAT